MYANSRKQWSCFYQKTSYETKKIIINLGKNYIKSDILFDSNDKFYGFRTNKETENKKLNDFSQELELGSKPDIRPEREIEENLEEGYCIRSGKKIKFNPKQPLSSESLKSWKEYGNMDFPEKLLSQNR